MPRPVGADEAMPVPPWPVEAGDNLLPSSHHHLHQLLTTGRDALGGVVAGTWTRAACTASGTATCWSTTSSRACPSCSCHSSPSLAGVPLLFVWRRLRSLANVASSAPLPVCGCLPCCCRRMLLSSATPYTLIFNGDWCCQTSFPETSHQILRTDFGRRTSCRSTDPTTQCVLLTTTAFCICLPPVWVGGSRRECDAERGRRVPLRHRVDLGARVPGRAAAERHAARVGERVGG